MGDNPVVLPDYIPDELLDEHLARAREQVAGVHRRRVARRVSYRCVTAWQERAVALAVLLAVLGACLLTVLWAWLGRSTGETIWWWFAGGGGVLALIGSTAASTLDLANKRRGRGRW